MDLFVIPARPHDFELDLRHAALLVIDVQNDFCDPEGFCQADLGLNGNAVRPIIEPIKRLVSWARGCEVPVIWTLEAHQNDLRDLSPSKAQRYKNAGYPVGSVGRRGRFLVQGEWGAQVISELAPREEFRGVDPGTDLTDAFEHEQRSHHLESRISGIVPTQSRAAFGDEQANLPTEVR